MIAEQTTETLREEVERQKLTLELRQLTGILDRQTEHRASELAEAYWQNQAKQIDQFYDVPGFGPAFSSMGYPINVASDRMHGRDRPIIEQQRDLDAARGIGRFLHYVDAAAIGALGTLTNYVIGSGYNYTVSPKEKREKLEVDAARGRSVSKSNTNAELPMKRGPAASAFPELGDLIPPQVKPADLVNLVEIIQAIVDKTHKDNDWNLAGEREEFIRLHRDGEAINKAEWIGGFEIELQRIEPEFLRPPPDAKLSDVGLEGVNWWFGIATQPPMSRPLAYYVDYYGHGTMREIIPADIVSFAKCNTDKPIKRGLSDYYAVFQHLRDGAKVFQNTARGSANQAAIAWIREHSAGVSREQINKVSSGLSAALAGNSPLNSPASIRTYSIDEYLPGTVIDVPQGQVYKEGPLGSIRNPNLLLAGDAILRYAGLRWHLPDFMITGSAKDANYASALVAESPFVKFGESQQKLMVNHNVQLLWKALTEIARHTGFFMRRFGLTIEQIKSIIEINVATPRLTVRNRLEETQINEILNTKGILSDDTWATREELDLEEEQAKGAERHDEDLAMPFGGDEPKNDRKQDGAGDKPTKRQLGSANTGNLKEDVTGRAVAAALESVQTTDQARAVLSTLFD